MHVRGQTPDVHALASYLLVVAVPPWSSFVGSISELVPAGRTAIWSFGLSFWIAGCSGTTPNGLLSDRRVGATRYQFNDAGTALVPYDAGQYAQVQTARSVIGGEGRSVFDGQTLMPDVDRNILYTHFDYDISDKLRFTTDFSWGKVDTGEPPGRSVERLVVHSARQRVLAAARRRHRAP